MRNSLTFAQQRDTKLLTDLFQGYTGPNFAIRLWDDSCWQFSETSAPACTIVIKEASALRTFVVDPSEVALGEAYIHNEIDVEGDIFSVFDIAEYLLNRPAALHHKFLQTMVTSPSEIWRWIHEPGHHTRRGDRESISYHYDQPVDFFRSWLGKSMVYSCAYFRTGDESLDQAQENKLDHICRKLRLRPLEHFLDIGCGWGSLILHAALQYGAYAEGITLSRQQADTTEQRIHEMNAVQSCTVARKDYRDLVNQGQFDKIASVGMFEHVGRANLPQYFAIAYQLLKPGGVFLNHGIATSERAKKDRSSFIDKYVFPGGDLVTIHEALAAAEHAGFELRDVENLREHYEKTLRMWVNNLDRNMQVALQYVSETTCRIWRLYMAGSAAAFRRGEIAIYQTLLSRPENGASRLPLTREDWYCPSVSPKTL